MSSRIVRAALVFSLLWTGACAQKALKPPIRSDEPIGVQFMRAEPNFVGAPFRILVDFESESDLAFLSLGSAKTDTAVAHTGNKSLQIPPGNPVTVKLNAMLGDGTFPGSWTLAGAYFISKDPAAVSATYEVGDKVLLTRTMNLQPRQWTAVMLDVSTLNDPNAATQHGTGVLRFKCDRAAVWCDDIVLFDNTATLVGDSDKAGDTWTVRQRGFTTFIERPGSFKLSISSPDASTTEGWSVTEANDLRVLLTSKVRRTRAIYVDGRGYLDSRWHPVSSSDHDAAFAAQHQSPAEISVPEEMGRVERNSPGDKNNDGYNEATGAYQVKANGPRIRITLSPRTPKLIHPIIEITGLPQGRVVGNMEGQLLDKTVRLPSGHVLVEVPSILTKPTTLDLRVQ